MSVINAVYTILVTDEILKGYLAASVIPGLEDQPAVYDGWAPETAKMPYINVNWAFPMGDHWAKTNAVVTFDIFTEGGNDSTKAEDIKKRLEVILEGQHVHQSAESGPFRVERTNVDGITPDPEPDIIHWVKEFEVIYWRKQFIEQTII